VRLLTEDDPTILSEVEASLNVSIELRADEAVSGFTWVTD